MKKKKKMKRTWSDKLVYAGSTLMLIAILVIVGYPVLYVISASMSNSEALLTGRVVLWPVNFTLDSYKFVMKYKTIWLGLKNTVIVMAAQVSIEMMLTVLCAYPLSKKEYKRRKVMTVIFFITMMFSAGLVPSFLIKSKLGLVGTRWAVIFCGCLGVSNMLIVRTAFKSVPNELYEAAQMDGATHFQSLWKVGLPLIKATLSVILLYSMVGAWNEYFNSMIYLRDKMKYPLQLILRTILLGAEALDMENISSSQMLQQANDGIAGIKYALIVMSTVPILIFYLAIQKSFKKGVMVGSVKG